MALNRERVMLVVAALRSGQYPKGRFFLHEIRPDGTEGWCCLGVCSDVARRNGLVLTAEIIPAAGRRAEYFDGQCELMSPAVRGWFGFESGSPLLPTPQGTSVGAAHWNDWGMDGTGPEEDFTAIADAFERLADAS